MPAAIGDTIHPDRFHQLVREGRASPAQLLGRYTPSRLRATLVAVLLDIETRLTDAALDMADRIIGASFTRAGNAQKRTYAATTRDVGRIMRLFDRTVAALEASQDSGIDEFTAVDAAVGWDKLLRARSEARIIAALAEENPLIRAADRWKTLRKFAPLLLEAIDFKAGRGSASTIAAVNALRELNRSGRRDVPVDAPMPFRKEWRALVLKDDANETRVKATDLSTYSVIAFATHGLIGGSGADAEPALVMTPPPVATDIDDGLLAASEAAQLKLDADWVILSACDSAGATNEATPTYSGLARAFFQAGAKSMLVSMWPVRDDVAARLTVAATANARRMSKARALQKAALALMHDQSISGAVHPALWAGFNLLER